MGIQVINLLPQPVDIYLIKKSGKPNVQDFVLHSGKIRPEHFRIESLKMNDSEEFWIAGYIGKKNLVYFSQHMVPNKNFDQIIEIQNYMIQSQKLADNAAAKVSRHQTQNISTGIWITMCLLLLFLNIVLLARRK